MDKKIVTAIFIILCIIVPALWFSFNYMTLSEQGNTNAAISHKKLIALVQNIVQSTNLQQQTYQLDMFIKQEPEISSFALYRPGEKPLLIYPGDASLEQLKSAEKTFNTAAFITELPNGYTLLTIAAAVPAEHIRRLGFEALGLFLAVFFVFIIVIALWPVKHTNKYMSIAPETQSQNNGNEPISAVASNPKPLRATLFDPETGLCWAEDLVPRLDEELKRSASFENELVFIIASLDMNLYEPEDYKVFCETVQKFFSFRDMIFQYKNDSIGIILQNMDIDHALRMCDELIKKITYLIQQNKNEMHYVEAFFGMSTRGGRILDSKRLIHEAETALTKAKDEHDTHVVAFKPNLEKYKHYIATNGQDA